GAHAAEVVGRVHETAAEMIVPDAVDDGTPGQHVVGVRQPVGQGGPTAAFVVEIGQAKTGFKAGNAGECPGQCFFTGPLDVAALQDVNRSRLPSRLETAVRLEVVGCPVDP